MSNTYTYKSIAKSSWVVHKDRGSKFIAKAFKVEKIDDIKAVLHEVKTAYPDATHWCWAAISNFPNAELKTNDNGEPNGTAGLPILRQIQANELNNCLVVVVRYFGGTKLGTRGLIDAYGAAAQTALAQSEYRTWELSQLVKLQISPDKENQLYVVSNKLDLEIVTQHYDLLQFCLTLRVPFSKKEQLKKMLLSYFEINAEWL